MLLWYGIALVLTGSLSACVSQDLTILDLTHAFDEHTIYWPNNKHFHRETTAHGITEKGHWYASGTFSASEHGGTHMDAPNHFAASGISIDAIPIDQFMGLAIVIDIQPQSQKNPDYTLTISDITRWESTFGRIPPATLVLLRTGWGQYWPDKARYLGSNTPDDPATLHFPGFSGQAMRFLVHERQIRGVGIDTASIDHGQSRDFIAHQVLSEANHYALENIAALDQVPATGAMIYSLPIKIKDGTGGPVRILAMIPAH